MVLIIEIITNHGCFDNICQRFVVIWVACVLIFSDSNRFPWKIWTIFWIQKVQMFDASSWYRCLIEEYTFNHFETLPEWENILVNVPVVRIYLTRVYLDESESIIPRDPFFVGLYKWNSWVWWGFESEKFSTEDDVHVTSLHRSVDLWDANIS